MIIYDKILYPRTHLELITGIYYILNANNQLKQLEYVFDKLMEKGKFRSYTFLDIESAISEYKNVVLLKITNICDNGDEDRIYRWFEVPERVDERRICKTIRQNLTKIVMA